ncbi:hypothetical protein [Gemmata sp.]|uniref:hypothetical protein n=1 Tax=Gemmata sp. TaxID=1914242 RepID=UPI003F729B1B
MNHADVAARVGAALADLLAAAGVLAGDGPDAAEKVGRALAAAGCHGPAHDPLDCPVATWVRRRAGFGGEPRILLKHTRAVVTTGSGPALVRVVVELPAAVTETMRAIDGRRFPWLTDRRAA